MYLRCRPEEAREVFDAGLVREEHFRNDPAGVVRNQHLLCRVGGSVYRWRHAVPALAARVMFPVMPWRRLLRGGILVADPADSPSAPLEVRSGTQVRVLFPLFDYQSCRRTRQPCSKPEPSIIRNASLAANHSLTACAK